MAVVTSSRKSKKQKRHLGFVPLLLVLLLLGVVAHLTLRDGKGDKTPVDSPLPSDNQKTAEAKPLPEGAVKNAPKADAGATNLVAAAKATGKVQKEEPIKKVAPTNHVLSYRNHPASSYIKNEADQIIVFTMQGADYLGGIPPLPVMNFPDGGNKVFLDSLTNEIVITKSDTPEIREQKEILIDCRKQIKEVIDNGGTFVDAITEYQNRINENANIRLAAIRRYQQLKAEDPEAAEEYRKVVNEELEREGITPIGAGLGRGRSKTK